MSGVDGFEYGRGAAGELRRWAFDVLVRHGDEDTLPTSNRHLFYEAVMAGVIAKGVDGKQGGRRPDQNLTDAITWLREQGLVSWGAIEDRTRHIDDHRGDGQTIHDGVYGLLDRITIDPWDDVLPIIVAESESVAGVLVRFAADYRVPIIPTRGQSNGFLRTVVARQLDDRDVVVCYLGDADKAGADIEANTQRVLDEVLDIKDWQRATLTWEQVETHGLPTVERTDGRDGVTYEVCEIEALPQRELIDDVTAYLDGWRDWDFDDVQVRESVQRDEIDRLLGIEEAE